MKDKKGSVLWRVAGGGKTWVDKGVGSDKRIMSWRYPIRGGRIYCAAEEGGQDRRRKRRRKRGVDGLMAGGSCGRGRRRGRGG